MCVELSMIFQPYIMLALRSGRDVPDSMVSVTDGIVNNFSKENNSISYTLKRKVV